MQEGSICGEREYAYIQDNENKRYKFSITIVKT